MKCIGIQRQQCITPAPAFYATQAHICVPFKAYILPAPQKNNNQDLVNRLLLYINYNNKNKSNG